MIASSRRRLVAGLAGAAVAGRSAAAAERTASHADAYLITLCAEFIELEHLSDQMFKRFPNDDECDSALVPIRCKQHELTNMIKDITPTSVAGFAAMARAATAWAPEIISDGQTETHAVLIGALLRGLVGEGAEEKVAHNGPPRVLVHVAPKLHPRGVNLTPLIKICADDLGHCFVGDFLATAGVTFDADFALAGFGCRIGYKTVGFQVVNLRT